MIEKKDIKEFSVIIAMSLFLLSLSLWVVYYIIDNYVDVDSIFGGNVESKNVYILEGVGDEKYLPFVKKILGKKYNVSLIKEGALNEIASKRNVLLLIDAKKLDENTIYNIENYVKKGGALVFNYSDPRLVKKITHLKYTDILHSGKYKIQSPLLSPLKVDKQDIRLYDDIFLYDREAILDLTKENNSYGVMWNGNYGKGNWVYFSFPFYLFQDNSLVYIKDKLLSIRKRIDLLTSMVEYGYYGYKVVKYPFIDKKRMVLINEYIDYKFHPNFINFVEKMGLKATLFINPNIVHKKLNFSKNIEIATMSDVDKWKLQKYTSQTIVGYSNENKQPDIKQLYNKYGLKYMIGNGSNSGIYFNDFVVLAHDGFNDIKLEDDLEKIKKDIDFYSKYRIYTITIHSYILGYKDNFEFLKQIINHAKKYPILKAKEIAVYYKDSSKITMKTMLTPSGLAIQITNDTLKEIHNFTFRVYSKYKFDRIESNFFNITAKIVKETPTYVDVKVQKMNKNVEFYLRFKK